ncbi:MAG: thioredoxin, partial [Planctomycetota bacterium]
MSNRIVACEACGSRYNIPETFAGKRAKCKNCGAIMTIPAAEAPAPAAAEKPVAPKPKPPPAAAPKPAAPAAAAKPQPAGAA